jgi:beta-phosphoglucomutase-like phosphatase (HAD superfamily)
MIRALIFDFNGVIADDDPIHMQALREVAGEEGLAFTDEEYIDEYLPLNDKDCFKRLYEKRRTPLFPSQLDELIRRKSVYYFQAIADKSVIFGSAASAVRAAAAHCPLAIASGAKMDEIRHILKKSELDKFFTTIVAAEDVEFGKPHPEPFLLALQRLKGLVPSLQSSDCVAIEDSIGGIHSAHEAGMRCLAIAHSYNRDRLREAEPEWIIDSIADFSSWLEKEVST